MREDLSLIVSYLILQPSYEIGIIILISQVE